MSFLNKVVVITGSSSGIGAATAIKFAQEGAKVIIVGRNKDKLDNVSLKCETAGSKPLVIIADVCNDEDLKKIVDTTIQHFGKLDILINNAGLLTLDGIMSENAIEAFDKVMATNLRSAVFLTHLSAPHLIRTKGNIVNVSSISAMRIVLENSLAYQTSKAALDHFTRSVALELAPKGVRVNSVNPGFVRTDLPQKIGVGESMQEAFWDRFVCAAPLGKIGVPEEIADVILFVASDKAGSITGSSLVTDNGSLLLPPKVEY